MDNHETDLRPRQLLVTATAGFGGVGLVAASLPFVQTMLPSEAAKAAGAPVQVDVSKVGPGMLLTIGWRGKPVWIVNRTAEALALLGKRDDMLLDPQSGQPQQPVYARNATRSITPRYFVAIGICTHLGCIPSYRPEIGATDLGVDWPGGFYCPCHGSKFDLAGRVFKNVPAPLNLEIPRHQYLSDTRLLIGKDSQRA